MEADPVFELPEEAARKDVSLALELACEPAFQEETVRT